MKGFPLEFGVVVRGPKCLNDGATRWIKSFKLGLGVLIQYRLWQTATQPDRHVAVASTRYAIASRIQKRCIETQTLRAGCSKADPEIFDPPQTPFPGARDGGNLFSWREPLPTDPVWWRSMHVISSYRGNRPTNTPTNNARPSAAPATDRTDNNTLLS